MYVDDHVTSTSYLVATLNTLHNNKIRYHHIMLMIRYSIITACKHLWWYHGWAGIISIDQNVPRPTRFRHYLHCICTFALNWDFTLQHLACINQQSHSQCISCRVLPSPSHPCRQTKVFTIIFQAKLRLNSTPIIPFSYNSDQAFMRIQAKKCCLHSILCWPKKISAKMSNTKPWTEHPNERKQTHLYFWSCSSPSNESSSSSSMASPVTAGGDTVDRWWG